MEIQEVYIVDDAADYRLLLQHVFKRFLSQYKVHFFVSGDALYEHLMTEPIQANPIQSDPTQPDLEWPDQSRPDLILLDLNMPGLGGYQTLISLKQSPWKHIPVVIMTSEGSDEEIEKCYKAGVNSFVIKPIGIEPTKQLMDDICQHWLNLNRLPFEGSTGQLNALR